MEINVRERCERLMDFFRENTDERTFKTWFEPVRIDEYDERKKMITLCVPSKYVYEYLEQYQVRFLARAIEKVFGQSHRLRYRVVVEADFAQVVDHLKRGGMDSCGGPIHISIPSAKKRLEDGLRYYIGEQYKWLPAYDRISDWLTDNKGRGLLCVGTSGLGKTIISQRILPVIFGRKVASVTAREMNIRIDDLVKERCVIIDDLGKEDVEVKNYGNRRTPFFELCDAAEKRGILLVITTNLSTTPVGQEFRSLFPSSIEERYGREVVSRLRTTTRVVTFAGEDMRN